LTPADGADPRTFPAIWNGTADLLDDLVVGFRLVETLYFTSNNTFTKATYPWLRAVHVTAQGAGGGGGGSGQTGNGGGGGGGAYCEKFILASSLASSETVTVGAGGSGGTAGNNAGGNGGASSFGSFLTAGGGLGGNATNGTFVAVTGGAASGGDININGGNATPRINANTTANSQGGNSILGFAASITPASADINGGAGSGYGGGGSGGRFATFNTTGGAGAPGVIILKLYA
jgi:hypothetical protein